MSTRLKRTRTERATEYLQRVAELTGAKQDAHGKYRLRAGRKRFLVDSEFIHVISRYGKSTCFSVPACPDMPSAEVIATALLQLKNNPKLFEKWREWPTYRFKPNGKMFRGADWTGWQ